MLRRFRCVQIFPKNHGLSTTTTGQLVVQLFKHYLYLNFRGAVAVATEASRCGARKQTYSTPVNFHHHHRIRLPAILLEQQGKLFLSLSRSRLRIWSRGTEVRPSRPASACSFSKLRLNLSDSRGFSRFPRRPPILYRQPASSAAQCLIYKVAQFLRTDDDVVRSLPRVRRPREPVY